MVLGFPASIVVGSDVTPARLAIVFDFEGSVAEWVGVFVAVATLLVGSGGGVHLAGVRHRRLDDRRKLLLESMTWLKGTFPVDDDPDDDDVPRGLLLDRAINRIDETNRTIRLLPWVERALWHRIIESAIYSGRPDELFKIAAQRFAPPPDLRRVGRRQGRPRHPQPPDLETMGVPPENVQFLMWSFAFQGLGGFDDVVDFENRLVRKTNPTLISRWANFRQMAGCYWRGPRPWSAAIRPTQMEFYLQIRNTVPSAEIAWYDQRHPVLGSAAGTS